MATAPAGDDYSPITKRQEYELLRSMLFNMRSSFLTHWRELGNFIAPRRPRFDVSDVNRGDRRNQNIIDSTATLSLRTLSAGMMAGITNPSRRWFKLETPDPDLNEYDPVKNWLQVVTDRLTMAFLRSNLYRVLPMVYSDLGQFGTSAFLMEEDFNNVFRFNVFPIGSYMLAQNAQGRVDTFFRDFTMSVRQIVMEYGMVGPGRIDWRGISSTVKNLWLNKQYEEIVQVCHVIKPNPDADPRRLDPRYKPFTSCTFERGVVTGGKQLASDSDYQSKFLRESGFDRFRVMAPRWQLTGEDVYATDCPGMTALGDIKQLQAGERRGSQALEKIINPPMTGPPELRSTPAAILPGFITITNAREGQQGFRPAHEIRDFRLDHLEMKQQQIRSRIQRAFFEDLFLMLSESDRREITAREVEERHEEKLLAVGPVLEQLNQDVFDPLIDNAFEIAYNQGLFPKPPRELEGQDIMVRYTSILAESMKLLGLAGLERFSGFVGQIATATGDPSTIDVVNTDKLIQTYGKLTSVETGILRSDEELAAIRQQRQQAAQMQQKAAAMEQAAGAAKNLAAADTSGDNALTRLIKDAKAGEIAPAA